MPNTFTPTRTSIVIVSLNGRHRIDLPLLALQQGDPQPWEIILVDNGSTDGLSDYVRKTYPKVKVIRSPRNLGFAGGNNLGLAKARGDLLVLLNDDTEPYKEWLSPIINSFRVKDDLGIVGCQLLYPGGGKIQHLGGVIHPNGLTDHCAWGKDEIETNDNNKLIKSHYATGAAMAIRRQVLEEVGLLDEGFWPIYFEEVDFSERTRRAGWKICIALNSKVIHHESQTTVRFSRRFLRLYHRNRIRFLMKNRSLSQWPRTLYHEVKWMVRHRPWTSLWPCALAYAWAPIHALDLWKKRQWENKHQ